MLFVWNSIFSRRWPLKGFTPSHSQKFAISPERSHDAGAPSTTPWPPSKSIQRRISSKRLPSYEAERTWDLNFDNLVPKNRIKIYVAKPIRSYEIRKAMNELPYSTVSFAHPTVRSNPPAQMTILHVFFCWFCVNAILFS